MSAIGWACVGRLPCAHRADARACHGGRSAVRSVGPCGLCLQNVLQFPRWGYLKTCADHGSGLLGFVQAVNRIQDALHRVQGGGVLLVAKAINRLRRDIRFPRHVLDALWADFDPLTGKWMLAQGTKDRVTKRIKGGHGNSVFGRDFDDTSEAARFMGDVMRRIGKRKNAP